MDTPNPACLNMAIIPPPSVLFSIQIRTLGDILTPCHLSNSNQSQSPTNSKARIFLNSFFSFSPVEQWPWFTLFFSLFYSQSSLAIPALKSPPTILSLYACDGPTFWYRIIQWLPLLHDSINLFKHGLLSDLSQKLANHMEHGIKTICCGASLLWYKSWLCHFLCDLGQLLLLPVTWFSHL